MEALFGSLFLLIIIAIGLGIYFIPSIIGFVKGKHNRLAIFALNFLAGWSFVGWIIAFIWALTNDENKSSGQSA